MDNKGLVFTRPRDTISFFVGIILAAFGLVPALHTMGLVGFTWPISPVLDMLVWVAAVGGAYVVIDGFIEPPQHSLHWFLIVAGIVLLLTGLIPLLNNMGTISFSLGFLQNLLVYHVIIGIEGILLVIGGLTEH